MKMDEIETDKLIELIRRKPGLYDKSLKEYRDRILNKTLWKEVCEEMYDTWSTMPMQEKKLKAKEIQQRWQNLRTCFKRELNKTKSFPLSKKRRKYIYYNQLSFLLTSMYKEEKETPTREVTQTPNTSIEKSKTDSLGLPLGEHEQPVWKNMLRSEYQHQPKVYKDDIDEDKTFLLSLVPSFRKMTDDQKLEAKIEFLSIVKRISQSNSGYANAVPVNCFVGRCSATSSRNFTQTLSSDPTVHSDVSQSSFLSSSTNQHQPSEFMDICQVKVEDA